MIFNTTKRSKREGNDEPIGIKEGLDFDSGSAVLNLWHRMRKKLMENPNKHIMFGLPGTSLR